MTKPFQLTDDQRNMAKRHGAVLCGACGRPFWARTGEQCDDCTAWAARLLHSGPAHQPGETTTQTTLRLRRLRNENR